MTTPLSQTRFILPALLSWYALRDSIWRTALVFFMSVVVTACGGGGNGGGFFPFFPLPTQLYAVGGTVTGLTGSGLVLQNNGGDDLAVPAGSSSFRFAGKLAKGEAYAVRVKTQPGSPAQTCTVNSATGTVADADVSTVTIVCASNSVTVSGTVSGLVGSGLVLQNNGADSLAVAANGSFTFATPMANGATYAVTVSALPAAEFCSVTNGSGTAAADVSNVAVQCSVGSVTTVAGTGAKGSANGNGTAASFNQPFGMVVDSGGNLYVADSANNTIRKITPARDVTTFAGSVTPGSTNGNGTLASFDRPTGLASDTGGNFYTGDFNNNMIRKITPAADVTTIAGSGAFGSTNGNGTAASFNNPAGVAVDAAGNVYISDYNNNLIRKITPAGDVTTFAGSGAVGGADGNGTAASFNSPVGLALDAAGNLYVADSLNNVIRKITPAGDVTTFAGSGTAGAVDGNGTAASFRVPNGVTVDASGNIYVADYGNNLFRVITPAGDVRTLAGSGAPGAADGKGAAASFNGPVSVVLDGSNAFYVADYDGQLIRRIVLVPGP